MNGVANQASRSPETSSVPKYDICSQAMDSSLDTSYYPQQEPYQSMSMRFVTALLDHRVDLIAKV